MNRYRQVWQPWELGLVVSLALWALVVWAALALVGCAAALGGGAGSVTRKESVTVHKDAKPVDGKCVDGNAVLCCCDLSREGVITCRCPHPGGAQ